MKRIMELLKRVWLLCGIGFVLCLFAGCGPTASNPNTPNLWTTVLGSLQTDKQGNSTSYVPGSLKYGVDYAQKTGGTATTSAEVLVGGKPVQISDTASGIGRGSIHNDVTGTFQVGGGSTKTNVTTGYDNQAGWHAGFSNNK